MAVTIKSKEEIQCMRDAGKILAEIKMILQEVAMYMKNWQKSLRRELLHLRLTEKGKNLSVMPAAFLPLKDTRGILPQSVCQLMMRWCMVFHRKNIIYSMEIL